jgi:hypothetical protein
MLEHYLSSSLELLEERLVLLKSGRRRDLPAEFDLTSKAVSSEVDRLVSEVHLLRDDHDSFRYGVGSVINRYRELIGEATRLESVVVPALASIDAPDVALTRLLRQMHGEANFPLLCPAVVRTSQEMYWIDSEFHLLGVPFREDHSPLQFPVFYHELAHLLFAESNDSQVAAFQDAIIAVGASVTEHFRQQEIRAARQRVSELVPLRLKAWRVLWIRNWIEELCCDAFAAVVGGPAYAWAFMHGVLAFGSDLFELPTSNTANEHPADAARVAVILTVLTKCGWHHEVERLTAFWLTATTSIVNDKAEEFDQCYPKALLDNVADQIVLASEATSCSVFQHGEVGTIRSKMLEYWQTVLQGECPDENWMIWLCMPSASRVIGRFP